MQSALKPSIQKQLVIMPLLFAVLILIAQWNYLLFHTLAELISIVVAGLIYVLGTQTHEYSRDNFLLSLGSGYLFIAILNIFHTLTYFGMGVFPDQSANVATQFWLAYRLLTAITLLIAPIYSRREIPLTLTLVGYIFWTGLSIASILWLGIFPASFVTGEGLTLFKIYTEYLIIILLLLAGLNLRTHKTFIHNPIYHTLLLAIGLNIVADFSFTLYSNVYGFANLLGHLFEITSLYFIYRGIVSRGLKAPYQTIFKKLTESNAELKQANRYKSDFLAGMGHEMRTPLTAVIAFGEDLLQEKVGVLNETQKEHVRDILTNGRHLLIQINDLLDFSKIDSSKMSLELTEVEAAPLIIEQVNLLRAVALRKDIEVHLELDNDCFIIADEAKVRQVIRNLLSNAIKFTTKGEALFIRLRKTTYPVKGVTFEFQDCGIGIPLKEHEKVFDAFYQIDSRPNKKYAGTGLGLALVKKIVELHKGKIWLESKEGRGTTFYVFLAAHPNFDTTLKQ
jgi:signal transduction histidine kinase